MTFSLKHTPIIFLFLSTTALSQEKGGRDPLSFPDEIAAGTEAADVQESAAAPLPTYISLADDISRFSRFADGGSDSNWYVGFNNAWIVKLPPRPQGRFSRVFIGAKLGRAKSMPKKNKPWEHDVIPGKIYIAVSQKPTFSSEQSYFLAETKDIPLEPDASIHLNGTGHSVWFWSEVPARMISANEPNYLIVWSPTREFKESAVSPILAAAEAGPDSDLQAAWNNRSIQGVPPRVEAGALETPIKLRPGIAIKLVPPNDEEVIVESFEMHPLAEELLSRFSVIGRDVESAWIEMSLDELEWNRVSSYTRNPPFSLSIPRASLPPRGAYFRVTARDSYGNEGRSGSVFAAGQETP